MFFTPTIARGPSLTNSLLVLHVTKRGRNMPTPTSERVRKRRDSLRAAGLRPVQIWVPDTRREGFAKECRRQSLLVANDRQEAEVMAWIEDVSDTEGWK